MNAAADWMKLAPPPPRAAPLVVAGIDPGPVTSGTATFEFGDDTPHGHRLELLGSDKAQDNRSILGAVPVLSGPIVVEDIGSFGMAVGRDVFETVKFIGVLEHLGARPIYRRDVKVTLLGTTKGTDAEVAARVRQIVAMVNGLPHDRKVLKGTKCKPGPLYGIAGHAWQAAAVAITYLWLHCGLREAYEEALAADEPRVIARSVPTGVGA